MTDGRWSLVLLIWLGLAAPAAAENGGRPAFAAQNRPRIGLVLGGGGAKGFAHIGVIEELERRRIPVDAIAGTSMGAVVGSLYAGGHDAREIRAIADGIDWIDIFNDNPGRDRLSFRRKREVREELLDARLGIDKGKPVLPKGVLGGQKLFATLQELLAPWRATEDFDRLPIPFRAVATDIVSGEHVVMDKGNLSTAVLASMSVPAGFPPVTREGRLLVDGSISDNLPVDVARAMGVDVVIVVDVGQQPLNTPDKINTAVDVFAQMQLLLGWEAIKRQRASVQGRDVLIEPDITGLSTTSFNRGTEAIDRGRAAAQARAAGLDALSVSESEWTAYLAQRRARSNPEPIRIAEVEIRNGSKLPDAQLDALVTTRPGDLLDGTRMRGDVDRIYALDAFERVDYRIDLAPGRNRLVIDAQANRGSDRYFLGGMVLGSNFGRNGTVDLALGYTDRNFLGTGAEWRGFARMGTDLLFDVSLYKQFGSLFVEPIAYYGRATRRIVQQGSVETDNNIAASYAGAGLDGGLVFGNWGELRAGVRFGGLNAEDDEIALRFGSGWRRDVDLRIGFTIDTLDAVTFPTRGMVAQVQVVDHVGALGGQFGRNSLSARIDKPISWGRDTLILGARVGFTGNSDTELLGDFGLGGLFNLSGLERGSLIGQELVFGRAVFYHRMSQRAPIFDLPVYIGGSLEAGNIFANSGEIALSRFRTAASAFIAADTPIGPFWLAYGNSDGTSSVYLVLGRVF